MKGPKYSEPIRKAIDRDDLHDLSFGLCPSHLVGHAMGRRKNPCKLGRKAPRHVEGKRDARTSWRHGHQVLSVRTNRKDCPPFEHTVNTTFRDNAEDFIPAQFA